MRSSMYRSETWDLDRGFVPSNKKKVSDDEIFGGFFFAEVNSCFLKFCEMR